jgi:hypothetical protein
MQRTKRFNLRRVALGLALAAILVPTAQAKPTASNQQQPSVEIPYLSGGVGVSHMDFDPASSASGKQSGEIAYLSHGATASGGAIAADDLTVSRPSNQGSPAVGSSDDGFEVGTTVGGFGLALVLLIGGTALVIRHSRKTRLSPA